MKTMIRDAEGNVAELVAGSKIVPPGWELVPAEEAEAELLVFERARKLEQIRAERNRRLAENDKQWLIASKKGDSTSSLESEAQALRDLPESAEEALADLETVEDIQAYDAFAE